MTEDTTSPITIGNDGPNLISSNYWQSDYEREGYCFLSPNAGSIRLLLPSSLNSEDMLHTKHVIISRGPHHQVRQEMIEIMFEDDSDSPFCLFLSLEQCLLIPKLGSKWKLSVWSEGPTKICEFKCYVRNAESLPCLLPL